MDIEKLLRELSVEEKVALVSGTDFMFTYSEIKYSVIMYGGRAARTSETNGNAG